MARRTLEAKLNRPEGVDTWTYLDLPFDAAAAFGTKGPVKVRGIISGHQYRSTAMPHGDGRHLMVVNKTIRDAVGAVAGGTVHVVMDADTAKRKVSVPADFRRALAANAAAKKEFKGFAYSHKKEIVDWICDAKRSKTCKRRMAHAVEKLAARTA